MDMLKLKEVIKQTAAIEIKCIGCKVIMYNSDLEPIGEYGFNMVGEIVNLMAEYDSVLLTRFKKDLIRLGVAELIDLRYGIKI